MRVFYAAHPVPHRIVNGVAERPRAGGDWPHFRAQQFHAEHVGRLPTDVLLAHVNDTRQAEMGTSGRGRHAMLAGSGFGNDACLTHSQRQQCLPECVIDLMGASVV